ncbi:MAG: 1-acyl-sn-glycerol-3-phosphate acyltransferase [Dysgonamonadaceae bacterium]|jgi:1-acyl-sn-glycerol-3-phosphate acyltransferase|nr:1-acyl-sn-glycerol-3-phosphate acyltransferase [Dysgonamonadaceae bacterium]
MKRIILILYQLFVWLPLFLAATILAATAVIVGCMCGGEKFFGHYPGAWWARFTCIITLCPTSVKGWEKLDRNRSYIFVSNHQGAFDIFFIYGYIGQRIKWVMKQSLRNIPLVGKACETAGFIFVDNSSPQAAAKTVAIAESRLTGGASIVIFPEGSRSQTGKLGKFKKGAFQMALDLKLPIVPVTINGSYEVMKKGSFLINPHRMEMVIHDPISTENIEATDLRQMAAALKFLSEETKNAIESGLWERYKK